MSASQPRHLGPMRRRVGLICLVLLLLLVLLMLAWSWQTYRHAQALRRHAQALRALDREGLSNLGAALDQARHDMTLLRRDLALPLALGPRLGWVPEVGPTLEALPVLFSAGEAALDAALEAWAVAGEPLAQWLAEEGTATEAFRALHAGLGAHAASLEARAAALRRSAQELQAVESARLLPPLRGPVRQVQDLVPLAVAACEALPLLPKALPADQERIYLLLAQNDEELRPTGGFISSIGTLMVQGGLPRLAALQDSYQVENWTVAHPDPPEPLRQYMGLDLWTTRDGNWWPDFPTSAQAVARLYELNQGRKVDGVLAVDMTAAVALLEALTPLALPDGQVVAQGGVKDAFRQSWSLAPGSLTTAGEVVTATHPFTAVEVKLALEQRKGRAWFDSVVLEDARQPGHNLVRNPSFEEDGDGDGLPDGWQASGWAGQDRLVEDVAHDGRRALLLVGDPERDKSVIQRLALVGEAGDRFRLAAESRADGVTETGGDYALEVTFFDGDRPVQTVVANFPALTHEWATAGTDRVWIAWWARRKEGMNQMLAAAAGRLLGRPGEVRWGDLLAALKTSLAQRHIQLYVEDPALQSWVARQGWDGALVETEGDYLLVVDTNVGYNKVNSNIAQTVRYTVQIAPGEPLRAELTLHYRHQSRRQVTECDKFTQYTPVYELLTQGCYWDYLRIYVPQGAQLLSCQGADEPARALDELGRTVWATSFLLRPREEREVRFSYTLPAGLLRQGRYTLYVQKQAGTGPLPLWVTLRASSSLLPQTGGTPTVGEDGALIYATDLAVDRAFAVKVAN